MSALDRQRVEQERIKLEEQIQEVRGHSLIKKKFKHNPLTLKPVYMFQKDKELFEKLPLNIQLPPTSPKYNS